MEIWTHAENSKYELKIAKFFLFKDSFKLLTSPSDFAIS